jgi:hypothetical protein
LPSIQKLLEGIVRLQKIHNVNKTRREADGSLKVYGYHRVFIDTPMLRYPLWQSLQLTPEEYWHYGDEALEFMKANEDGGRNTRWVGFKPHQIERFDRSLEFMKQGFDNEKDKLEAQENFVRFFAEHDRRRNTDIHTAYPEFSGLFNKWKIEHNVDV